MLSKVDDFGTPDAYNHYAVGWAHAMNTPYQWTKQVASHWGGTRNGTIVHWPNGFDDKGKTRNQFHHVIDVAQDNSRRGPDYPSRSIVNSIAQAPLEGVSMLSTLRDGDAPENPQRPVLRDIRQPRHLPPGLDCGHQAPHAVEVRHSATL